VQNPSIRVTRAFYFTVQLNRGGMGSGFHFTSAVFSKTFRKKFILAVTLLVAVYAAASAEAALKPAWAHQLFRMQFNGLYSNAPTFDLLLK
jgi:hypothetical protein